MLDLDENEDSDKITRGTVVTHLIGQKKGVAIDFEI